MSSSLPFLKAAVQVLFENLARLYKYLGIQSDIAMRIGRKGFLFCYGFNSSYFQVIFDYVPALVEHVPEPGSDGKRALWWNFTLEQPLTLDAVVEKQVHFIESALDSRF